ncbi:transcription elongation factor B polypeptide 3-like [Paramacrobiotus metropolitanus]|uniref:transcription elongation factor B polypeptide 3-like n=1 Tax=Paramacrobiotus metropolitanus TaxID=2943436 RepID=UPI00244607D7|nr:transcription elongation factor B polypeptide 3-like [Paramacrobiotus metropolitanus]
MEEHDLLADVEYLKRKLERYAENDDQHKMLKVLSGLDELEMSVFCLKETGIGKVVNGLRKRPDEVGGAARDLIIKWKSISVPVAAAAPRPPERRSPPASSSASSSRKRAPSPSSALDESLAKLPCLDDPDISSLLSSAADGYAGSGPAPALAAVSPVDAYAITSRKGRTQVFSGRARQRAFVQVPKLVDLCIRVLMDHIDEIEEMGPVPYHVIKPVLEACTAPQLRTLEHHNPHLVEDADELWIKHCEKDFRAAELDDEDECWRDLYARKLNERESKLQELRTKIKANTEARAAPVRQTKVAVLDGSLLRKGGPRFTRLAQTSQARAAIRSMPVPPAPARNRGWGSAGTSSGGGGGARTSSSASTGKKSAPMMAKTLKDLKNRFR